jgi:hypothetical protein
VRDILAGCGNLVRERSDRVETSTKRGDALVCRSQAHCTPTDTPVNVEPSDKTTFFELRSDALNRTELTRQLADGSKYAELHLGSHLLGDGVVVVCGG